MATLREIWGNLVMQCNVSTCSRTDLKFEIFATVHLVFGLATITPVYCENVTWRNAYILSFSFVIFSCVLSIDANFIMRLMVTCVYT